MFLLVLDIGNNFLKACVYQNESLTDRVVFPVNENLTEALPFWIGTRFFDAIGFVNVNQKKLPVLEQLTPRFSNRLLEITALSPSPVRNGYLTPQTLGADRFAAAVGAKKLCPDAPVLVIDAGTAITYDFVTADGVYLGGGISPGVDLRYQALNRLTARLPLIEPAQNAKLVGQNTEEAIRSGVQNGVLFEMEGAISAYQAQFGPTLQVFLTGGWGSYFEKQLKTLIFALPNLTPDGVRVLVAYQLNG